MIRYMVVSWNPNNEHQRLAASIVETRLRETSPSWKCEFSAEGVRVFCILSGGMQLIRLRSGLLIGTLFKSADMGQGHAEHVRNIHELDDTKIINTNGRHLVEAFWGSYVAILVDQNIGTTRVLRGPVSSIACLTTGYQGVQLCFSDISSCHQLGLLSFSINWRFVARTLARMRFTGETGLNEVYSVTSGECLEVGQNGVDRLNYWDPLSIARSAPIEDIACATTLLKGTTIACARAWATCNRHILLRLSGGLDSSIVLGSLKAIPLSTEITCITRFSAGVENDERNYARAAADHAGVKLVELSRSMEFDIERMLHARLCERPQLYLVHLSQAQPEIQFARKVGATAIFDGSGGDELFYASNPVLPVADYIHHHGVTPRLFEHAMSAARLDSTLVWSVLREAISMGVKRAVWDPLQFSMPFNTLLNVDMVDAAREPTSWRPFWYDNVRYVPPGKQLQVAALTQRPGGGPPFEAEGDPEYTSPLISQPLIELCLKIPTYVLMSDGWDRVVARKAFSEEVPEVIRRRRTKGGQEAYTTEIFRRNRDFIRSMLLDGYLVRNGFLDKRKLDEVLSSRPSGLLRGMNKISKHLGMEVWLSTWEKHGAKMSSYSPAPAASPGRVA